MERLELTAANLALIKALAGFTPAVAFIHPGVSIELLLPWASTNVKSGNRWSYNSAYDYLAFSDEHDAIMFTLACSDLRS